MANVVFDKYSIKTGLFGRCLKKEVFDQIQQDVEKISRLTIEASIYIHFRLYRDFSNGIFPTKKIKFEHYFHQLKVNKTKSTKLKYKLDDSEYQSFRYEFKLQQYDVKQNIFNYAVNQYETNFITNISTHAYKHVNKFLNVVQRKILKKASTTKGEKYSLYKKRRDVLNYVFNGKNKSKCDKELLAEMQKIGFQAPFGSLRKNYFKVLKVLYNVQRFFERENVKNFNLVPIMKHGRHHVRYDTRALWELLQGLDMHGGAFNVFKETNPWPQYFDLKKLCRGSSAFRKHRFGNCITTDGVSVTFVCERINFEETVQEEIAAKEESRRDEIDDVQMEIDEADDGDNHDDAEVDEAWHLERIKAKHKSGVEYTQYIGLDPGLKLTYGGASYRPGDDPTVIKWKSSMIHDMCRIRQRQHRQKNWCSSIDNKYNRQSKTVSSKCADFRSYTRFRLLHFSEKQEVYEKRKVARLRFQKYIMLHQATSALAKRLVGSHIRKTLVFVGASKTAANSPMKGYMRSPHSLLLRKLRVFADVVEINEYNTTKLCSRCFAPMLTSDSKSRYRFCQECRSCWNRDVNAGHNIYQKGICMLEDRPPPHPNFIAQNP